MGYVLTDADIVRLWQRIRWGREGIREWFAGLPVVSRDEARRALWPMTDEEYNRFMDVYFASEERGELSRRTAFFDLMEARRVMLDAAPTEPNGNEPTTARSDLTETVHAILDIVDLLGEGKPIVIGKRTLDRLREAAAKAKREAK